ncbi:N-6 DNA methylase [Actinocrispum sp. NPDC049592]|uniref:N-6 DNA methylase n=1 Tax=Actinocrispum sp. NPDC049592 TaxID=3154835 RepID=UPI0034318919
MSTTAENKFGRLSDLSNEATVEQFFVNRLLSDLGYVDKNIRPKVALDELAISLGRKKVKYRPDYAMLVGGKVRWICEAKAVDENLDDWVSQCSSYCLELNKEHAENPVEYFLLTNGVTTRLYRWDSGKPLVEASFHHFVDGNQQYDRIRAILSSTALRVRPSQRNMQQTDRFVLRRKTVSELNADFAWAHRQIYKREHLSYAAAFMEFVKIVFLKLLSDRDVHSSANAIEEEDQVTVPIDEVRFSRRWIEIREKDTSNPLDSILFQDLLSNFETEIREGKKKRIFNPGERLNISPDTIKAIAERFQNIDLISIDADLNGRMFETFLNSTLRGKALGQYFTPRSVVKLAVGLANLDVGPKRVDVVMDACCGTGGFLIEALAAMWSKIEQNSSLSNKQREELRARVATECLIGVDVARDPALARIARINMYLHGDGGSSIYQLDALDKKVRSGSTDSPEIRQEKTEFRKRIEASDGLADVVLTNPPFAKDYSREQSSESTLLDDYELAYDHKGGSLRPLATVSSMVMFLERYHDLLKPGGRLITVIDDSLLGANRYRPLRDWIRRNWLVRAVVSLPGDAFQRSQARVKTSVIMLQKRLSQEEEQPAVFMYYCTAVGIDDPPRQRVLPIDEINRKKAIDEIRRVGKLYEEFFEGKPEAKPWAVPASAIGDRMDVKACLMQPGRRVKEWEENGLSVVTLQELIRPVYPKNSISLRPEDVIDTAESDELVTYLRVRYDGFTEAGDEVWTSDISGQKMHRVRTGDIVISHINAIHGAIGVVPPEHDGLVVTSEYTVCTTVSGMDPKVVWTLLRSPEVRAELLILATGIGRTRITWDQASKLMLPVPDKNLSSTLIADLTRAENAELDARNTRTAVRTKAESKLQLGSSAAQEILAAFKPPR